MRVLVLVPLLLPACVPPGDVASIGPRGRSAGAPPLAWPELRGQLRRAGDGDLAEGLCCRLAEALQGGLQHRALDGSEAREWLRTARVLRSAGREGLSQALLRAIVALSRDPGEAAAAMLDRFERGDLAGASQRTRVEWLVHCAGLLDQRTRVLRVLGVHGGTRVETQEAGDAHRGSSEAASGALIRRACRWEVAVHGSEQSVKGSALGTPDLGSSAPQSPRSADRGGGLAARSRDTARPGGSRASVPEDTAHRLKGAANELRSTAHGTACAGSSEAIAALQAATPNQRDDDVPPWRESATRTCLQLERALRDACTCSSKSGSRH